jgi:outer membrane receptor protein involved in Fe transport
MRDGGRRFIRLLVGGYMPRRYALASPAACAVLGLAVTAAWSAEDASRLQEVVIIARKYQENLQDVPLSISALSAPQIERLGVKTAEDVAKLDASVIFDRGYGATDNRISIRGLSPTRGRATVAVLVDGIDISSESVSFAGGSLLSTDRLLDLQRIEIVKGPQSALYGRSAFAGAIQYVTQDPSQQFEGNLRGDLAEYGRSELAATVSGPISEKFGVRLNAATWNSDGTHSNSITGARVDGGDGWGAALTAKWQASEALDVKTRLEYMSDNYGPGATAAIRHNVVLNRPADGTTCLPSTRNGAPFTGTGCPAGSGTSRVYSRTIGPFPGGNAVYAFRGTVPSADQLTIRLDPNPLTGTDYRGTDRQVTRGTVVATWKLGAGTLKSFTGYTNADFTFDQDGDFDSTVVNGVEPTAFGGRAARFDFSNTTRQLSEELRFRSELAGPFNFAVGGLYWNEKVDQPQRSISIFCLPALPANAFGNFLPIPAACGSFSPNQVLGQMQALSRPNGRDTDHKSVYGLLEFKFASIWKASAEARYSDETEDVRGVNCSPSLTLPAGSLGPGSPPVFCNDPTLPGSQVFGPSINFLYPYFGTLQYFAPGAPATPGTGVQQAPGVPVTIRTSHRFTTPKFTLETKPNENALFYASAARAVKPGGVSTVTTGTWQDADYSLLVNPADPNPYAEFTYKDEKLTEYELGAKLDLFGRRLRLNPTIFEEDYKDKQASAQLVTPSGASVGRIINAGKAKIRGVELDLAYQPTDNLSFGLNYTYLDAKFTDFPLVSSSPTDAARVGSCPRVSGDVSDARVCHFNLKGNRIERAPEHSLVVSGRYAHPLSFGTSGARWFIESDVQTQGERYLDIFNTVRLDDYVIADLRLGVTGPRWEALLYVDNLFDNKTVLTANGSPGDVDQALSDPFNFSPADTISATLPDPRIIGLRVNFRLGGNR